MGFVSVVAIDLLYIYIYTYKCPKSPPTLRGAWSQCLHFWSFQQTLFTSSALMTQLQRQMRWEMALIHLEGGNFEDHRASHATIMALKVRFWGEDFGGQPSR